jgi:long-chain fatty acid transport protein
VASCGGATTSIQACRSTEHTLIDWSSPPELSGSPGSGCAARRRGGCGPAGGAVYAAGLGLHPLPTLTLAADVRYIAYDKTRGFQESGFNADGSVRGFGWKSIWVTALGAQFDASSRVTLRGGYNHGGNPISRSQAFFNIPAPAIIQDHISVGLGYKVSRRFDISAAYYRGLKNSVSGPIPNPALPPGSTVTSSLDEDSVLLQFSFGQR